MIFLEANRVFLNYLSFLKSGWSFPDFLEGQYSFSDF
jgi:hypothetical protein